jgi:cytochrome c oxidase subunit 3
MQEKVMEERELVPFKVESHPDTGLCNAKFGIWLFLASEIMLFGALFSSYILLRAGAVTWPVQSHELNVPIGALNSVILLTSSIFIIKAWVALKEGNLAKYRKFMILTIVCAVLFLSFKGVEYTQHFMHHEYPKESIFLSIYFLLTGLHALHILGGIAAIGYFTGPGSRLWSVNRQWLVNRVEVVGLYWHFVDIVWIFLFSTLYLM